MVGGTLPQGVSQTRGDTAPGVGGRAGSLRMNSENADRCGGAWELGAWGGGDGGSVLCTDHLWPFLEHLSASTLVWRETVPIVQEGCRGSLVW